MLSKLKLESTAAVDTNQPDEPVAAREESLVSEKFVSEHERIAQLAYSYWQERGYPEGSPEQDWFRAEQLFQLGKLAKQVGHETGLLPVEQALSKSA